MEFSSRLLFTTSTFILLTFLTASCRLGDNTVRGKINSSPSGAISVTPDPFQFSTVSNSKQLYLKASEIQQVTGIDTPLSVSIQGSGGAPFELGEVKPYIQDSLLLKNYSTLPRALRFSGDGTKLFVLDGSAGGVLRFTLRTPWNVSTATYDQQVLDITGEVTIANDLQISSDGMRIYVLDISSKKIFQYELLEPWELTSAQYNSAFFDPSPEDAQPRNFDLNSSESKLYVYGGAARTIYQYSLNSIGDITSATYDTLSFPITVDTNIYGFTLGRNDEKLYVLGDNSLTLFGYSLFTTGDISSVTGVPQVIGLGHIDVYSGKGFALSELGSRLFVLSNDGISKYMITQHNLESPWDIDTLQMPDNQKVFGVGALSDNGSDVAMSPDGTKLYYLAINAGHQLTLTTPFDIRTAQYPGSSKSFSAQDGGMSAWAFKPDGSKLYVVGYSTDRIYQYTLATPWDLTSATYDGVSFLISGQDTLPYGLCINTDGSKLYLLGRSNKRVYQYTLPTPWTLTGATYDSVFLSVSGTDIWPQNIEVTPDGSKLFLVGSSSDAVKSFTLGTPWNLSSASIDSSMLLIQGEADDSRGMAFTADGSEILVLDSNQLAVYQYSLSTPWDPRSAQPHDSQRFSVINEESNQRSFVFKPDGTKMYVLGSTYRVHQYTLTNPWQVSTASFDGVDFDVSPQSTSVQSLQFNSSGTKMYVVSSFFTSTIYQYTLSTAWDVSTAIYDALSFDSSSEDISAKDMVFNDDGTKMFILGSFSSAVYQYSLVTPFDVSTASYDNMAFSLVSEMTNPNALVIADQGTKLYALGSLSSEVIYQYRLNQAWEITGGEYIGQYLEDDNPISEQIQHFEISPSGNDLYKLGNEMDSVYQYSIGRGGDPEYRICADANCDVVLYDWRSDATGVVSNDNYIQLRLTSAGAPETTNTATLTIGEFTTSWQVSTEP